MNTRAKSRASCLRPAQLSVEVMARCGLSVQEAKMATKCVFEVIVETLRDGNSVRLPRIGLLQPVLRYDVRWQQLLNASAVPVPIRNIEFVVNQDLFHHEKRPRRPDIQPEAGVAGDPIGHPGALRAVSAGSV